MQSPQSYPHEDFTQSVSLIALLDLVRRRKLLLALPIILVSGAAIALALALPDTYMARTLMMMDLTDTESWMNPMLTVQRQLPTIRETVNRRTLLEAVNNDFALYDTIDGRMAERDLDDFRTKIIITIGGTQTFYFAFSAQDPELAARVVARTAEVFVEHTASSQESRAAQMAELLQGEVDSAEQQLLEKQNEIAGYQRGARGALPDSMAGYLGSLQRVTAELQATNGNIAAKEAERAQVQTELDQLAILGSGGASSPSGLSLQRQTLMGQLATAKNRGYTESHPYVVRLRAALEDLDDAPELDPDPDTAQPEVAGPETNPRVITLRAQLAGIDTSMSYFESERRKLMNQMADLERLVDPTLEQELAKLVRDTEITRVRYLDLLGRLQEARLNARLQPGGGPVAYEIVEAARVPSLPSGPLRARVVGMGVLVAIFLAGGLVLVAHQLDSSFTDTKDLREFTRMATLASIPSIRHKMFSRGQNNKIPTLTDRVSIASEQYRILASRLRHMIDREYSHVVLFTSSAGSEGKTTTVLNVAIALSEIQEDSVLLIDADLRKPRVREYLPSIPAGGLGAPDGFRDLLKRPDGLAPEFFGTIGNLHVLAGARGTDDSLDDLVSESARKALARLRKRFKYILVDSPPVLPMVDSHLLAELADRVVFVVRAGQTRRETLARALESFDSKQILGLVLNDVSFEHARYAPAYSHYTKEYLPKSNVKAS